MKRFARASGQLASIDASVSPTGQHIAVFRSVSFSSNNWMHRVEVDGKRGPAFRTIGGGKWSDDGTTYLYVGENFQGQIPGSHIVYAGERSGPYAQIAATAINTDGSSWAALVREQRDGPTMLIVDGKPHDLAADNPPVPETLRFHPIWKAFVYKRGGDAITERWFTIAGKPIDPPQIVPLAPSTLPPGVTVVVKKVGKAKDARQQLIVNGATVGEFGLVVPRDGNAPPAYVQPDGSLIIYVVEGNQLVRLRL